MTGPQGHINLQLCVTEESGFMIKNLTSSIQHQEPCHRH